jgi:hypothetical protein
MKFEDLIFNIGCCGAADTIAEVNHANGKVTEIHKTPDGFRVLTRCGNLVIRGSLFYADEFAVMGRVAEDE